MLQAAGLSVDADLTVMVIEKVWRERMPADYLTGNWFTPIEYEGLMVMGSIWKGRTDR